MTETITYSLIGIEDLSLGSGTFEVTLADGRVVTLNQVKLSLIPSGKTATGVLFVNTSGYPDVDATNMSWDDSNDILSVKSIKILAGGSLKMYDTNSQLIHSWGATT